MKGVPVESETYQHLPLDDSGEHDHVTVAGATEDQAKTGVDVVDDDRVLEEQETNYDIEQLKSTTEDDNNTVVCNLPCLTIFMCLPIVFLFSTDQH